MNKVIIISREFGSGGRELECLSPSGFKFPFTTKN